MDQTLVSLLHFRLHYCIALKVTVRARVRACSPADYLHPMLRDCLTGVLALVLVSYLAPASARIQTCSLADYRHPMLRDFLTGGLALVLVLELAIFLSS